MSSLRRAGDAVVVVLAVVMDLIAWAGDRELRNGSTVPLLVIPLATVVVYLSLLVRWRQPFAIFWLHWTFALISLAVPQFQPFAGVLIALHAVASRLPARLSAVALAALAVPFGVHSYNSANTAGGGVAVTDFVQLLILWVSLAAAVWVVGRISYASARRAWRLRELQAQEAAEAVTAERMRLARDLHDIVAHAVTTMMLQAAGAQAVLGPGNDRVRGSLSVIEKAGVQAMTELHRMLGLLHAVEPEAVPAATGPQPTVSDITSLVDLAAAAGQEVHLVVEGIPGRLDASVEVAAYRVVQESLTNSAKHSGSDATITVLLQWTRPALRVRVTDRSHGVPLSPGRAAELSSGHGLEGLRERVQLSGGTLRAGPTEGGFEVVAELPRADVPKQTSTVSESMP
jgi:signal transduction histidine kinase